MTGSVEYLVVLSEVGQVVSNKRRVYSVRRRRLLETARLVSLSWRPLGVGRFPPLVARDIGMGHGLARVLGVGRWALARLSLPSL